MNLKKLNELRKIFNELADEELKIVGNAGFMKCINEIRSMIAEKSIQNKNPVDLVLWIPIEKISANDYNPNSVATMEMNLLLTSVEHDGYTQPVVTVYDAEQDKYVIVDGFHRYYVMKSNKGLMEKNNGMLPVTVIEKSINDRMASTIRHNRARGKHSIDGMSNIVFNMLDNGWDDSQICSELGMEKEELIRLKHITGFSKLFENVEYKKEWQTKQQLQIRKNWEKENNQKAEC